MQADKDRDTVFALAIRHRRGNPRWGRWPYTHPGLSRRHPRMGRAIPEGRPSIVFTSPTCRFPPVPHGQSEYLYLCQPAKRGSFEATLLRFPMWSCADAAALWLATETQRRPRDECGTVESQGGLPFTRYLSPPPTPLVLPLVDAAPQKVAVSKSKASGLIICFGALPHRGTPTSCGSQFGGKSSQVLTLERWIYNSQSTAGPVSSI